MDQTHNPAISSFSLSSSAGAQAGYSNVASIGMEITASLDAAFYLVKSGGSAPTASEPASAGSSSGWVAISPGTAVSATFALPASDGSYTLTAWGKNAVDQLSSAGVAKTVTLDTTRPVIDAFSLTSATPTGSRDISFAIAPAASTTDIVGWIVNEDPAGPGSSSWGAAKPAGYRVASAGDGSKAVYVWAKDAAGNISAQKTAGVYIHETPVTAKTINVSTFADTNLRSIAAHEPIKLRFSEAMDIPTLIVTGALGGGTALWTNFNKDLDYSPPGGFWPTGVAQTLVVNAACAHGLPAQTFSASYEVFNGVCVSQGGGAIGYAQDPMGYIPAAITKAATIYAGKIAAVRVSAGSYATYWSRNSPNDRIVMKEGVSLLGGYATNWSARDWNANATTIVDDVASGTGSTETIPARTIDCGTGLTNATILEGFKIYGSSIASTSTATTGVFCENSSPTIRNNTIVSGNGLDSYCVRSALVLRATLTGPYTPMILSNTVNGPSIGGGSSIGWSYGIAVLGGNVSPTISDNTIWAGTSNPSSGTSYGIYEQSGSENVSTVISRNGIYGGASYMCYGVLITCSSLSSSPVRIENNLFTPGGFSGGTSYLGITTYNTAAIRNNIIVIGGNSTTASYGIVTMNTYGAVNASAVNNILAASSGSTSYYGIYEGGSGDYSLSSCSNNDFSNLDNVAVPPNYKYYYHDIALGNITAISGVNGLTNSSSNITGDPKLDASWKFTTGTSGSPATVTSGGLNLHASWGDAAYKDDPTLRPSSGPWSMGCYKY